MHWMHRARNESIALCIVRVLIAWPKTRPRWFVSWQVFQSSMHMGMRYFPYCSLHAQTRDDLLEYTLAHGHQLLSAYCRDRCLIPKGTVCHACGVSTCCVQAST